MLWNLDIVHVELEDWNEHIGEERELLAFIESDQEKPPRGYSVYFTVYDMAAFYLVTTTKAWLIWNGYKSMIEEAADYNYHLYSLKMYPKQPSGTCEDKFDQDIYADKEEVISCIRRGKELGYRE